LVNLAQNGDELRALVNTNRLSGYMKCGGNFLASFSCTCTMELITYFNVAVLNLAVT